MSVSGFSDDDRVVASKDLLTTLVDGEVMAMIVERGACYGLDPIGSRIWDLLAEPISVAELVDRLTSEYAVSRDQCRADVGALLIQMDTEGMIRRVKGPRV